jgi:ABC-type dipeptide/oligopeptide/nickel transport system ATPase component
VRTRVIVLYGGRIMEQATIDEIFYDSRHPYTKGLLASMPRRDDFSGGRSAYDFRSAAGGHGRSGRLPVRAALSAESRTLQF